MILKALARPGALNTAEQADYRPKATAKLLLKDRLKNRVLGFYYNSSTKLDATHPVAVICVLVVV